VALLFTQENIFAWILLFDFCARALRKSIFSPFHVMGKFILEGWGIAPKLCDESPKRFALYLGLVTSLILTFLVMAGLTTIATVVALVLLICALLETVFDFCIGCKLYYAIELLRVFKNDRNFH
jgi:hypothetical protein